MEPARRTTSAEGADICLKDLDTDTVQPLLPGDSASPELAVDLEQDLDQHFLNYYFSPARLNSLFLPSTPELAAIAGSSSPNIELSDLENIYIDPCPEVATIPPSSSSILPSDAETTTALASQLGAMSDSDLNEPLHRENTCLQVATIASSSQLSPYASSSATTSSGAPDKYKHHAVRCMTDLTVTLSLLHAAPPSMMTPDLYVRLMTRAIALFLQLQLCSSVKAMKLTDGQEKEQTITHVFSIARTKFSSASYKDALPEILQVLRAACIIHKLPLAQTWATCARQGKRCRHHSVDNCRYCISTIDAICYVDDPRMQFFHEACSEHHLLPGQGVAGKAFTTNQPCFLPDIGSSSEQEYPLSNHAKIFKLKGAVAIRLRCTHTGTTDFVLEFYLPTDCGVLQEQKEMLDSLWGTVRSLSKTLRMVTNKEMEDDVMWGMNEITSVDLQKKKAMTRKPMARRSLVWKSFTEVAVGDTAKAKCNHCGLELCCDSKTHGTSSMRSHLKRCKLNPDNRITGPL